MKVLGVDPGTRATGYGLLDGTPKRARLLECGVVRTSRGASLGGRLLEIHRGLLEVIDRLEPECVAVEGVFYGQNVRTAVVLGHARGAALLAAAMRDVEVVEYPPAEIKKAVVGTGTAAKEQVAYMVQRHLRLAAPPEPADAADGCAAALCHLFHGVGPLADRGTHAAGRGG